MDFFRREFRRWGVPVETGDMQDAQALRLPGSFYPAGRDTVRKLGLHFLPMRIGNVRGLRAFIVGSDVHGGPFGHVDNLARSGGDSPRIALYGYVAFEYDHHIMDSYMFVDGCASDIPAISNRDRTAMTLIDNVACIDLSGLTRRLFQCDVGDRKFLNLHDFSTEFRY
jgi:hypothetical protein